MYLYTNYDLIKVKVSLKYFEKKWDVIVSKPTHLIGKVDHLKVLVKELNNDRL